MCHEKNYEIIFDGSFFIILLRVLALIFHRKTYRLCPFTYYHYYNPFNKFIINSIFFFTTRKFKTNKKTGRVRL